jgi:hypothetical protein
MPTIFYRLIITTLIITDYEIVTSGPTNSMLTTYIVKTMSIVETTNNLIECMLVGYELMN